VILAVAAAALALAAPAPTRELQRAEQPTVQLDSRGRVVGRTRPDNHDERGNYLGRTTPVDPQQPR
jgi:hypothetical protein